MAHLTKEQYDFRRESAARRSASNEEIAVKNGMTEEQAGLISDLCSLRHELHTNIDAVTVSDDSLQIKPQLVVLNAKIDESGLPAIPCIPIDTADYIDIDSISELMEIDPFPEQGTPEWQERYDNEYFRIHSELEQLNNEIEKYLTDIDKKYKTTWCPSGALRIF